MYCPQCGTANIPEATACRKCATALPLAQATIDRATLDSSAEPMLGAAVTQGTASGTSAFGAGGGAVLQPGRVLGNRYEILALLGAGGMGAVYKVRDREIGAFAALKVIRPEMASRPEVLQRFK